MIDNYRLSTKYEERSCFQFVCLFTGGGGGGGLSPVTRG